MDGETNKQMLCGVWYFKKGTDIEFIMFLEALMTMTGNLNYIFLFAHNYAFLEHT